MKANFKYVMMMAAALTLGFSSCSNNDDLGNGDTIESGRPTKMTLAITQPTTYAGGDDNATAAEVDIKTVDVYIYNGTTFMKREHFAIGDFDSAGDNAWKLKNEKRITTTTGAKTIYVGVNLPTTLAGDIEGTNPGTIAQTVADAAALNSDGFAMFSRTKATADLVDVDATDYDTKNTVSTTVARLLAKVVVKEGSTLSGESLEGDLTDLKFTINNVNTKFFPLPSATFLDPNHTSPWSATSTDFIKEGTVYMAVGESSTAVTTTDHAIYTTENTSAGELQGDHTYVRVKGIFVPSTIKEWDGSSLTTSSTAHIKGNDFYKVVVDGEKHFFSNGAQAADYANKKANDVYVTYTGGVTYYNVFLNPVPAKGEKKFDVLRNTIYTVNITKVNGVGEGDGENTVVTDPEEPIAAPTNLSVEIDIEDWSTNNQDSELTGK